MRLGLTAEVAPQGRRGARKMLRSGFSMRHAGLQFLFWRSRPFLRSALAAWKPSWRQKPASQLSSFTHAHAAYRSPARRRARCDRRCARSARSSWAKRSLSRSLASPFVIESASVRPVSRSMRRSTCPLKLGRRLGAPLRTLTSHVALGRGLALAVLHFLLSRQVAHAFLRALACPRARWVRPCG